MFTRFALPLSISLAVLWPASSGAEDWPNWRGPAFNGSSIEKNLPVEFSPGKGVKWSTQMPGPGAGTPIVVGNNVFITCADFGRQALVAMCLDRKTGKVKWQKDVGTGYQPGGQGNKLQIDNRSNYASPSPVSDGKIVVFFFGNGDLAAYGLDGKPMWARNLQKDYGDFSFQWTFSSSPTLWEGKLYIQILQRDSPVRGRGSAADSYLMALDPKNGKELWKVSRPTDARMESREAYSTPIPVLYKGRKEIVIAGGDILTGHDAATGKELWRTPSWNNQPKRPDWRLVPSPVAGGDVVLACAPKGAPVYAAKMGQVGAVPVAWQTEYRSPVSTDVATPLFYQGKFYVIADRRRAFSCVDPATGKPDWTVDLPGSDAIWASPTGADGKIYLLTMAGEVVVVNAPDGKVLAMNKLVDGEMEIRSSIAVANGNLFVKTNTKLFCIGK